MRPLSGAGIVRRHGITVAAMAAGGVVTVIGSLLPWVRTGSRWRNSYDAFALVERIGFSPDGPAGQGLRWWPLVPLLIALAVVGAWWGWRRAGGAVGLMAGIYAGLIGTVVTTADARGVVDVGAGAAVTAVGGAILLLGSIATLIVSPPGRTPPTRPAP